MNERDPNSIWQVGDIFERDPPIGSSMLSYLVIGTVGFAYKVVTMEEGMQPREVAIFPHDLDDGKYKRVASLPIEEILHDVPLERALPTIEKNKENLRQARELGLAYSRTESETSDKGINRLTGFVYETELAIKDQFAAWVRFKTDIEGRARVEVGPIHIQPLFPDLKGEEYAQVAEKLESRLNSAGLETAVAPEPRAGVGYARASTLLNIEATQKYQMPMYDFGSIKEAYDALSEACKNLAGIYKTKVEIERKRA